MTAFNAGKSLTTAQIRDRFGFASIESVTATIAGLRKGGLKIKRVKTGRDGRFGRYSLVSA